MSYSYIVQVRQFSAYAFDETINFFSQAGVQFSNFSVQDTNEISDQLFTIVMWSINLHYSVKKLHFFPCMIHDLPWTEVSYFQ